MIQAGGDAGAHSPAQNILAEAMSLSGGKSEEAAAILAHSLSIAMDDLARARAAVSHGYVRANAQKDRA